MKNVWLYHINPKSPAKYNYGWDVNEPKTMLKTKDREWPASQMRNQVTVGDMLCVFSKKMLGKPDGVYVAGTISQLDQYSGTFTWRPNRRWSTRLIAAPVLTETLRRFFGRSYGSSIQRLPPSKRAKWVTLFDAGNEIVDGVPVISVGNSKQSKPATPGHPYGSKENGVLGEKFVLKILKKRYPKGAGYEVVHVAASKPTSDHDIAIHKGGVLVRLVEVKTRVGSPNDPVLISERELRCRTLNEGRHSIFIVYLGIGKSVASVLELNAKDTYALSARQYWLYPPLA